MPISSAPIDRIADRVTTWVGSTASIVFHTCFFILAFASHWLFSWSFDSILLVLTTVVSLEAIYISIFIQRAVNQQGERLGDVEDSLDDVEESIDEFGETLDDVEEALDEVEKGLDEVEKGLDDVEEALEEEDDGEADAEEESMEKMLVEMKKVLKEFKRLAKDQASKK